MGIFDNASSISIGNKEVASIKVGTATLYQKETPAPTRHTVKLYCGDEFHNKKVDILLAGTIDQKQSTTASSSGIATFYDVGNGTYNVGGYPSSQYIASKKATIVVDATHTIFKVDDGTLVWEDV